MNITIANKTQTAAEWREEFNQLGRPAFHRTYGILNLRVLEETLRQPPANNSNSGNNPVVGVPNAVFWWRIKLVLHEAGLLPAVEAAIAGLPEDVKTRVNIALEGGSIIQRTSPMANQIGAAVGLSEAALDNIFIQANKIVL